MKTYSEEMRVFVLHIAAILIPCALIMPFTFMLTYSEDTEKSAIGLSDFYDLKELLFLAFAVWKGLRILSLVVSLPRQQF